MTRPPSGMPPAIEGLEITRHPAAVELSWKSYTRAKVVLLPSVFIVLLPVIFAVLAREPEVPQWVPYLVAVLLVFWFVAFVRQEFHHVTSYADASGLRVHDRHVIGPSTSQTSAGTGIQVQPVHLGNPVRGGSAEYEIAVVGPRAKPKVIARGLPSEEAARAVEAELKRALGLPDHPTRGPEEEPNDPWEWLPGDGHPRVRRGQPPAGR